ncbi:hypothetical protein TYRP_003923 [Tyrophagus putrescentiae]|nr:hypothetical protein TYRP_003923 [Tyrophagus putrescentiae]
MSPKFHLPIGKGDVLGQAQVAALTKQTGPQLDADDAEDEEDEEAEQEDVAEHLKEGGGKVSTMTMKKSRRFQLSLR